MAKKKIIKEEVKEEVKEVPKYEPTVVLKSFTIKAVIPTGSYANIQPEIIVEAGTIEEARNVVIPIIVDMFQKYENGRIYDHFVKAPVEEEKSKVTEQTQNTQVSEGFKKAESAINTAFSQEALMLIEKKIEASKNLTAQEKKILLDLARLRFIKLAQGK